MQAAIVQRRPYKQLPLHCHSLPHLSRGPAQTSVTPSACSHRSAAGELPGGRAALGLPSAWLGSLPGAEARQGSADKRSGQETDERVSAAAMLTLPDCSVFLHKPLLDPAAPRGLISAIHLFTIHPPCSSTMSQPPGNPTGLSQSRHHHLTKAADEKRNQFG